VDHVFAICAPMPTKRWRSGKSAASFWTNVVRRKLIGALRRPETATDMSVVIQSGSPGRASMGSVFGTSASFAMFGDH
jgi:hypothetical protein